MHGISHLALCSLLTCFTSAYICAQNPSGSTSPYSEVADTLEIEWPRTVWFEKYKIKIGSFASAELKRGISSSSHKVSVDGRDELMAKEPFKLDVKDSLSRYFHVKGKWFKTSGSWSESNNTLFDLLNVDIQEETYSPDRADIEILSAEISHSVNPDQVWRLNVKRNQSKGIIRAELDAFLSNGERIILIMGPTDKMGLEISEFNGENTYYTFMENGIVLGRVTQDIGKIAFAKQTPDMTRTLLLAAAISL